MSKYKPNGPLSYSKMIAVLPLLGPLHYAYLVTALQDVVEIMYNKRNLVLEQRLESQDNFIVEPHYEKMIYEDVHLLMNIAEEAAQGELSAKKIDFFKTFLERKREQI